MATKPLDPRIQRVIPYVGGGFIVLAGLGLAVFGGGLAARLGGITLVAGCAAAVGGLQRPKQDSGGVRPTDEGLRLPRRLSYAAWLAATNLLLSVSMLCMGSAAINDDDYTGGFRGSAEVLVVLFPPLLVVGLCFVVGGLVGRGSVELTAVHLQFTPVVGRRRTIPWDEITSVRAVPGDALVVTAPRVRMVVPAHAQRWTPAGMEALVTRFRDHDPAGRATLVRLS